MKVKLGKSKNFQREVFRSTLFYDFLKLEIFDKNKIIYTTYFYPNRFSFNQNEILLKARMEILKKRLNVKMINIPTGKILKIEKILYYFIFLIKRFITKFFMPAQWIIGYRRIGEKKWNILKISSEKMQADPFIAHDQGKYYLFYEEMSYDINKGYISVGELDLKNKKIINEKIILEKNYHLSYPFIFKEANNWYMIPESSQNKTVDLYEAIKFPYEWKFKRNLLKGIEASDTTLLKKDGEYFLFTSESCLGISQNDELSIFKSKDLYNGTFKKIKKNPIISDVRCSRMGGQFYKEENKLYRVSQNCSKRYGYKVNIHEVLYFEGDKYEEKLVKTFSHPKGIKCIAMHTYNRVNEVEVTDFKILRLDLKTLFFTIKRNVKKLNNIIRE